MDSRGTSIVIDKALEKMPEYGKSDYWDNRYASEKEPFDWLFSWDDISLILNQLFTPQQEIILVGCGNAPLSPVCSIHIFIPLFTIIPGI